MDKVIGALIGILIGAFYSHFFAWGIVGFIQLATLALHGHEFTNDYWLIEHAALWTCCIGIPIGVIVNYD